MSSSNAPPNVGEEEEEEEEDDYMTMTFTDQTPPENNFQRTQRLKRESLARGRLKSKAELAVDEQQQREAALSRSLLDEAASRKSKGLAMMAKMGFKGGALGKDGNKGAAEPIKVQVKEDRAGIGLEEERRKRARELGEQLEREGKKAKKVEPGAYRERMRREREVERLERQVLAAMRLAEELDEEKEQHNAATAAATAAADVDADAAAAAIHQGPPEPKSEDFGHHDDDMKEKEKKRAISAKPLKSIPVLYRSIVKNRELKDRGRLERHALHNSLSSTNPTRLPTYEGDSDDEDLQAMGKTKVVHLEAEDLDESDAELEEFEALEVEDRLRRLLEYLRREHRYCFWCKWSYPGDEMEGCPGLTEEDHD
jgi:hypothetical protein